MKRHAPRRIAAFLALVLLASVTPVVAPVSVAYAGSVSANLTCVTFPTSSNVGYAAGESGTVRKTIDGGATWSAPQSVPTSARITGIAFWDANRGIAVTEGRAVYGTDNGGVTWVERNADMTQYQGDVDIRVNGVVAVPNTAYRSYLAAGDRLPDEYPKLAPQLWGREISPAGVNWASPGAAYQSLHWTIDERGDTLQEGLGDFFGLDFVNSTTGWAVGVDTWIGPDRDSAQKDLPQAIVAKSEVVADVWTWKAQTLPVSTATLRGVSFANSSAGVAVGTSGTVFRTTNGGVNWAAGASGVTSQLNGVAMATATQGWAVGENGIIRKTLDGGATWTPFSPGTRPNLTAIAYVSGTAFVVVGNGGFIQRFGDAPSDTTAPTVPTGVTALKLGTTSIRVSWTASTDASGIKHYLVYDAATDVLKATVTGTTADITGLVPDTTYGFYVKAVDNSPATNTSGASATASAKTDAPSETIPPTVPAGVTATPQSATSIRVAWTASTDASGIKHYLVYMNGALKTTVTGTSATITGLFPSTTYAFTVRAVDNVDNQSGLSTPVQATTPAAPDTTAPVITVTGVTTGGAYTSPVTVTFSATDAVDGTVAASATLNSAAFASGTTVSALGAYTLVVTAKDKANNTATRTVPFTIGTTPTQVVLVPVEGPNRYATAIAASQKAFPAGSDYVIIATGMNWPDALGGSALAGALDAPILLTRQSSLPSEVASEIVRLRAKRAIVLGGTSAVSAAVEATLKMMLGNGNVERLAGANRYETANRVAARTIALRGDAYDGFAFVATGMNFPDALGASPLAAANRWPIYLSNPNQGNNAGLAAVMKAAGVKQTVVLGGTNVVASGIESSLRGLGNVTRLSGANRYDTAVAVAAWGVANAGLGWDKVAVATGQTFPDALSGGVLQAKSGSVLLLTPTASLNDGVAAVLRANKPSIFEVRFLGSTAAVSQAVRTSVWNILKR